MRAGACTVQQSLTTEASSVLKQALGLAKRRGHAQVTPLHVAATLLSSTTISANNNFRMACLKSHHHPLPCRALALCLGVALNRLPTLSSPTFGSLFMAPNPSLSNALVAAIKRAHARQRKGCIEQLQQQQPLLDVKVELEQLTISILDDPGVSRVMREAGLSSTCIKNGMEVDSSSPTSSVSISLEPNRGVRLCQTSLGNPPPPSCHKEDLGAVVEALLGKKGKSRGSGAVVVGDTDSYNEGLVAELMRKVERGEVPEELRSVRFVDFPLSASYLRLISNTDVGMELSGLRRRVSSLVPEGRGVIVYLGDLKWVVEEGGEVVDHVVEEIGRLQAEWRCHGSGSRRVWLMATASYQTYMRCQMRKPSLEAQWSLSAVTVPSGGLALSLHECHSYGTPRMYTPSATPIRLSEPRPFSLGYECDGLDCCLECTSRFNKEAAVLNSCHSKGRCYQEDTSVALRRKWKRLCQCLHGSNQSPGYPCDSLNPVFKQSSLLARPMSVPFPGLSRTNHHNPNENFWQEKDGWREYLSEASSDHERKASYLCVSTDLALGPTPRDQEGEAAGLKLEVEGKPAGAGASEDHRKRRAESPQPPKMAKRARQGEDCFDLNISAEDRMGEEGEEEEHPSSVLTQESNVVLNQLVDEQVTVSG